MKFKIINQLEAEENIIRTTIGGSIAIGYHGQMIPTAVKAKTGPPKDWLHIASTLEASAPDETKLFAILEKHGLLKAWKRKLEDE